MYTVEEACVNTKDPCWLRRHTLECETSHKASPCHKNRRVLTTIQTLASRVPSRNDADQTLHQLAITNRPKINFFSDLVAFCLLHFYRINSQFESKVQITVHQIKGVLCCATCYYLYSSMAK